MLIIIRRDSNFIYLVTNIAVCYRSHEEVDFIFSQRRPLFVPVISVALAIAKTCKDKAG